MTGSETEKNTSEQTSSYDELKLHGIAISGIPAGDDQNIINVSCVPIAVSYKDRDGFELLEDSRLKTQVNLADAQSVYDCFIKIVEIFDHVVTLQHQALAKYNLPYRPVALNVGEDKSRQIQAEALYAVLFGADKILINIPEAKKAREDFFAQHPEGYDPYIAACKKLAQLSDQFALKWNSYSSTWKGEGKELQQSKTDRLLLKYRWFLNKGSEKAYGIICLIAEHFGKLQGEEYGRGWERGSFGVLGPPGYEDDKHMQERYPSYGAYLYWHPDFRKAYINGFNQTFNGPYTNTIRLALDPPSPLFTTPCSDRIRDQLQSLMDKERLITSLMRPTGVRQLPLRLEKNPDFP